MSAVADSSPTGATDDALTIAAISILAAICANVVHEGLGHGAIALLSGAHSGVLTTVAWTSDFDSRLVAAGGTLANFAAAFLFWIALRNLQRLTIHARLFLLVSLAFNLFAATGYFLFSGVADFGDWAAVIAGLPSHWLWRSLLAIGGAAAYYAAALAVGVGFVRYLGIPRGDQHRLRKLTLVAYVSSVLLACAGGILNPFGVHLLWQSALPATMGGHSALLWLQYAIPRSALPRQETGFVTRRYAWIAAAVVTSLVFVFVLGRGISLHR